MRDVGRIAEWRDDKGFGFVVTHDGRSRAFVHVKAFQHGSRRPAVGDLISYETVRDDKGRPSAHRVRHAGQRISHSRPQRALPRTMIALVFLVLLAGAVLSGRVAMPLAFAYTVCSAVSYIMYCLDKAAAGKSGQRIPESSLHLVDLLGGWPGGLIAQQQFRHKTVKRSYQSAFWFTVFVNLAALGWLTFSKAGQDTIAAILPGH